MGVDNFLELLVFLYALASADKKKSEIGSKESILILLCFRPDTNYEKEGKTYKFCQAIYSKLKNDKNASQEDAMERAEKLFKKHSDLPFHQQNPVSLVYKLVKYLNDNKRK